MSMGKMVSCIVMGLHCKIEDELFFLAAIAVSLEFMQQSQMKEQKTHSNRRVCSFD